MFSPAGREKTQNQCISIIVRAEILRVLRTRAGVDIHTAGAGGSVTRTLRSRAVMVRNSVRAGGSGMKKTVPRRALVGRHIRETYFAIGMTGVIHCIGYLTVKIRSIGSDVLALYCVIINKTHVDINNLTPLHLI